MRWASCSWKPSSGFSWMAWEAASSESACSSTTWSMRSFTASRSTIRPRYDLVGGPASGVVGEHDLAQLVAGLEAGEGLRIGVETELRVHGDRQSLLDQPHNLGELPVATHRGAD